MPLDNETFQPLKDSVQRFVRARLVPVENDVEAHDEVPAGIGLSMAQECEVAYELGQTALAFRSVVGTSIGFQRNGTMSSPTYLETFRTVIRQDDCDALGHMNVQHYFRVVSEGMFVLMARLGLGLKEIARRQLSFAVVHTAADFCRELHVGDAIALDSTITRMDDKLVVFHHQLRTGHGGHVAMAVHYKCVLLNLERRRAVAVPDDIRSAAIAIFPCLVTDLASRSHTSFTTTTVADTSGPNHEHEPQSLHR